MNERIPATLVANENVIHFPVRTSYEARDDPYYELGGGLPSRHEAEVSRVRPERTFFDVDERTPENAWQSEVNRAYDLSLSGVLEPGHLERLTKKDLSVVMIAVHDLYTTLNHRAPLLRVDGNYEHPNFVKYNFESQAEASNYAGILFALRDSLDEQPVVRQLLAQHRAQYGHKKVPQHKLVEARQLRAIVVDDNNEVTLLHSEPQAGRRLRLSSVD